MPGRNRLLVIYFILFVTITGCRKKETCIDFPDTAVVDPGLTLIRTDLDLRAIQTKEELRKLLDNNPAFSEFFLRRSEYPDDSVLIENYFRVIKDPYIDTLFMEVDRVFSDFHQIEEDFRLAFKILATYYPGYQPPKIQTVVTGLVQDMYISDSLFIIGLDYYLGEGARFRPIEIPGYILKRYQRRNVVSNTLLIYSSYFIKSNREDQTLLADMIYYGKAFQFTKQLMPCTPDSIIVGYSPDEMEAISGGREIIWANFIENEALYESERYIKDKFISERPKTFEIGENCPGRIGRWVGWEIVKSYLTNNSGSDLVTLMNTIDAQEIFVKSRYKPRNN